MRLKVFRAAGTREAMARVRAELGDEALILSTRRVADGVEVTAALEPAETPPPRPARAPDPARLTALAHHGVPRALAARLEQGPLVEGLKATLRFAPIPCGTGERPLLITGPPGAGKTLTTARLATRLVLTGTPPLVITADGLRAGATEQLAAFTRLLGLNLLVAGNPVTLARALAHRRDGAPVLIDAPGLDPFDPAQREALSVLAGSTDATVALVLPAGLDPAEAAEIAAGHVELGASLLVATRLDLARRLGAVLAGAQAGLALAEAGVGPGAADGLVPLTPAFLAERLLRIPPARPCRMQGAA